MDLIREPDLNRYYSEKLVRRLKMRRRVKKIKLHVKLA